MLRESGSKFGPLFLFAAPLTPRAKSEGPYQGCGGWGTNLLAVASAPTYDSLDSLGQKLTQMFPRATCIRILTRSTNIAPLQEVWRSTKEAKALSLADERVLGSCEKERRSVLITDSRKHPLLTGVRQEKAQSILCSPILDESRFVKGLICLSSDEPGAFNTHGRFACERIAQSVARTLEKTQDLVHEGEEPRNRLGPAVMGISLFLVFLVGALLFSLARTDQEPPQSSSVTSSLAPKRAAAEFARRLQTGEFATAWELLEPDLRTRWPQEEFTRQLSQWSLEGTNQEILLQRKLAGVREIKGEQVAVFFGTAQEESPVEWNWGLREVERRWMVTWMRGGPVSSPE